jgi:hypothetical protein
MSGINLRDLARYLVHHPLEVAVVVRAGWRLRARRWWLAAPYLPLPGESYWRFRMVTATGSTSEVLSPRDIVDAATWSLLQREGR